MTKHFDTLFESMISEMAVAWKGSTPEEQKNAKKGFVRRVADISRSAPMSGHWKPLKQLDGTGKSKLAKFLLYVCREILWDKHPETNAPFSYNPEINTKKELQALVKPAVEKVSKKSGWAQKFLSDRLNTQMVEDLAFNVVSNAIDNGEEVTQNEVSQTLEDPLADDSEEKEGGEAEISADEPATPTTAPESTPQAFNPRTDYYLEDEVDSRKFSKIPEADRHDLRTAYDRLTVMSTDSGEAFLAQLKKTPGLGMKQINQLIALGIMVPADSDSAELGQSGDTSGFDKDMDQFMADYTAGARKDNEQSSPGSRFGGEGVFG